MQFQTDLRQSPGDSVEDQVGLGLARTVDYLVIRIALEFDVRELPSQPIIEGVVEEFSDLRNGQKRACSRLH